MATCCVMLACGTTAAGSATQRLAAPHGKHTVTHCATRHHATCCNAPAQCLAPLPTPLRHTADAMTHGARQTDTQPTRPRLQPPATDTQYAATQRHAPSLRRTATHSHTAPYSAAAAAPHSATRLGVMQLRVQTAWFVSLISERYVVAGINGIVRHHAQ
jgi:hypothetical protein